MFRESGSRSLLKMITFRVVATMTTMLLVFIFVGKMTVAVTIGVIETLTKMVIYYVHERLWDRVSWGKKASEAYVLWFTGLPSSGKTTLAETVSAKLTKNGFKNEVLDGDRVREIFPKTGFSREERDLHCKKIGFLASMLEKNGVIAIAPVISPYAGTRQEIRKMCKNFVEIHVATSLEECQRRDVKRLYKGSIEGKVKNLTGVDDPYEVPENPELVIDTAKKA